VPLQVWPAHKCVCGPGKALPFAALPLSEAELAELHRRLDEVAVPGGSAPRTLRAELQPLGRKPAEVRCFPSSACAQQL